MTTFSFTWNSTFLGLPQDTELESLGAGRIRDTKSAVGERIAVDHSLSGDANDGKHLHVTLRPQASSPSLDPGDGSVYSATGTYPPGSTTTELFYRDNKGHVAQLTVNGSSLSRASIGSTMGFAGASYVGTLNAGWVVADGTAYSRTTYALAFAVIGTFYGPGDGSTTFNVGPIPQTGYHLPNQIIFLGP